MMLGDHTLSLNKRPALKFFIAITPLIAKIYLNPHSMAVYPYPLLIEKYKDEILAVVGKNSTTIVKGPTGCGKSTFIPLLFCEGKMAIVEPRRIAVTALYTTLAPHIPSLGFKMRFSKKICADTRVTIFTDGSFLNEISTADYDYIIIDEVHERSVRTDTILGILRKTYKNKLILMSASLDTAKLQHYFSARTYEIPGRSHPAEIKYLEKPTSDYVAESYLTVKKILKEEGAVKKDILVFLPGEEDINELCQLCKRIPGIVVHKIHASMGDKEQQRIYEESNLVRVILSTNICETSLTIPNIKYVIDSGLCKTKIFNEISHIGIQGIGRDSAVQRLGRCNRLGPGVCYRLYTEFELLSESVPEIMRSDLSTMILRLVSLGYNILAFEFLDFPPIKNCVAALEFLLAKDCIECFYRRKKVVDFAAIGREPNGMSQAKTDEERTNITDREDQCDNDNIKQQKNSLSKCSRANANNRDKCEDSLGQTNNGPSSGTGNSKQINDHAKPGGSQKDEKAPARQIFVDYSEIIKHVVFKITKYGHRLSLHPFDAHLANFYEQCIQNGIGYRASLLLSLISQENFSFMSPQPKKRADVLYLVDLIEGYLVAADRQKYCAESNVPHKGMEIASRMLKTLNKSRDGDADALEKIFSECFSHNVCDRMGDGSYRMRRNGLQVFIHPTSGFFKRQDRRIVVVDVFSSTKTYARVVGKHYE